MLRLDGRTGPTADFLAKLNRGLAHAQAANLDDHGNEAEIQEADNHIAALVAEAAPLAPILHRCQIPNTEPGTVKITATLPDGSHLGTCEQCGSRLNIASLATCWP